jgi:type VI secretion system protein VasJ
VSEIISARNLGSLPVSASQPAGSNPRDGETFDALQTQIDRLTDIHTDQPTEWPVVIKLAGTVLKEEGKDLAAGTWLALALFHQNGLPGLADGIHMLRGLVETYWEDMSPPASRLRGRRNQMQWLLDQLSDLLDEQAIQQMPAMEPALHATMLDDWEALDNAWQQRDDEAPAFYGLSAILRRLPVEQPRADGAASDASAAPGTPASPVAHAAEATLARTAATPATTPAALPATQAGATDAVENALASLHPLVAWFIQELPVAPMLFRLNRICAWTTLEQSPPAQGRATRLPPPPGQLVDTFQRITGAGEAQAIISFAESRLASFPCWLDLNRASHGALTQLGASQAAEVVARETSQLLARIPGLAELTFNDGQPFADPATQAWLHALQASCIPGNAASATDEIESLTREAESQAAAGKLQDALTQLQSAIRQAESRRAGFRLRLAQCALIHKFDTKVDTRAMVVPLIEALDAHRLPLWEPELARQALELATDIELRHGGDHARPAAPMLERLAGVDVPTAWQLSQPTTN